MKNSDRIRQRSKIVAALNEIETTATSARLLLKETLEIIPIAFRDESDSVRADLDLKNTLTIHNHSTTQKWTLVKALERMGKGTYGLCEACDEEIELDRLEVLPCATRCIECQSLRELGRQPKKVHPKIRTLAKPFKLCGFISKREPSVALPAIA